MAVYEQIAYNAVVHPFMCVPGDIDVQDLWLFEEHVEGTHSTYLTTAGHLPPAEASPCVHLSEVTYYDIMHSWAHWTYDGYGGRMCIGGVKGVEGTLCSVQIVDTRCVFEIASLL